MELPRAVEKGFGFAAEPEAGQERKGATEFTAWGTEISNKFMTAGSSNEKRSHLMLLCARLLRLILISFSLIGRLALDMNKSAAECTDHPHNDMNSIKKHNF